jgi:hypothetical protein
VCIRKSEKDNKGSLAYKFWNTGESYQVQVRVAHKLINKYGERAILHYLNSPNGLKIYSLGFLHKSKKFVLPLKFVETGIQKSKEITDAEDAKPKRVIETIDTEYKPRKSLPNKNSLLSKLRKVDGNN